MLEGESEDSDGDSDDDEDGEDGDKAFIGAAGAIRVAGVPAASLVTLAAARSAGASFAVCRTFGEAEASAGRSIVSAVEECKGVASRASTALFGR